MRSRTRISPRGTRLSRNARVLAARGNCVSVNGAILTYVFFLQHVLLSYVCFAYIN